MPINLAQHMVKHEQVVAENSQLRARIAELEAQVLAGNDWLNARSTVLQDLAEAQARIAELEAALSDTTAHLVAAVSLLERGGKKAAPSNTMFAQMLVDHKNSIERARAALGEKDG